MESENLDIRARLRGGHEVEAGARGMSSAILRIGTAGQQASRGLGAVTGAARGFGNTVTSWRSAAVVGSIGYTAKALAGVGLGFDARMEQNQVAFTQFLGSAGAARRELGFLQTTAAHTPFELPQITTAERRLLAFGFGLRESNKWLGTIGDTIAGMGGGAQEIDQLVTAIGQIRSKGRLQGDELMQLSELGVVNREKLSRDLGITPLQLMSGQSNITARRALAALKKQLDDTFGGQSAKQARTFSGQMSTLHDELSQTLGTLAMPAFRGLEHTVFPQLDKAGSDIQRALKAHPGMNTGQQLAMSWRIGRRDLQPLVDDFEQALKDAHLDQKFADVITWATPKVAEAAAHVGEAAIPAFFSAWWKTSVPGKLILAWFVGSKLGLWRRVGALASDAFFGGFAARRGGGGGGGGGGHGGVFAGVGALAARGLAFARYAGPVAAFITGSGLAGGPFGSSAGLDPATERQRIRLHSVHGGALDPVAYYRRHPGQLTPEIEDLLTAGQRHAIHVYIDGEEVAHRVARRHGGALAVGVMRAAQDAAARK